MGTWEELESVRVGSGKKEQQRKRQAGSQNVEKRGGKHTRGVFQKKKKKLGNLTNKRPPAGAKGWGGQTEKRRPQEKTRA